MCVHIYIYIYICIYIYIHIHIYIYTYIFAHTHGSTTRLSTSCTSGLLPHLLCKINACIHTYMHITSCCILEGADHTPHVRTEHTYIHTKINACLHTYIHITSCCSLEGADHMPLALCLEVPVGDQLWFLASHGCEVCMYVYMYVCMGPIVVLSEPWL